VSFLSSVTPFAFTKIVRMFVLLPRQPSRRGTVAFPKIFAVNLAELGGARDAWGMNKVAIRVAGDRAFFDEVAREAARLDRSPSWLLADRLGATLPKLDASMMAASVGPSALPKSESKPRRVWTFFVPRDVMETCSRLAVRLKISSDDIVAWAWQAGRADVG